jgi:K+-sensing histidine kinase KdpD
MKIIVETAGAQKGALILNNLIEAEYLPTGTIITMQSKDLSKWLEGSKTVIDYVTRTCTAVVVGSATEEQEIGLSFDPYIKSHNVKSVLGMPIIYQGELKGVLYVENNLIAFAFTEKRVQILSILASQMAISLVLTKQVKGTIQKAEKKTGDQKKRAEKAESNQKKQEEFIDRICHEIRNPIQGVFGNCDLLTQSLQNIEHELIQASHSNSIVTVSDTINNAVQHVMNQHFLNNL